MRARLPSLNKNAREGEIQMKKPFLMPMKLQFFAEETADDQTATETTETEETAAEETTEKELDSEKVVEKLQKRLASKTASEKETKTQLEQALARISELEKGNKKSVKEKSEEEKLSEAQKAKDDEIATLRKQIKVAEITQQADEVLKESGLSVGKDILNLIVSEDEDKTYSNVKAMLSFLAEQQKQWEIKRNTGQTPRKKVSQDGMTKEAIMAIKDPVARQKAIEENLQLFNNFNF